MDFHSPMYRTVQAQRALADAQHRWGSRPSATSDHYRGQAQDFAGATAGMRELAEMVRRFGLVLKDVGGVLATVHPPQWRRLSEREADRRRWERFRREIEWCAGRDV